MKTEQETITREFWDKTWKRFLRHQGMIAPSGKLIQLLLPYVQRGDSVLDLGCGEGRNTMYLSRIGYRGIGLDLSAKGVKVLINNLFEEEVKGFGIVGDARIMPFSSASFGGILAHNLFDHLDKTGFEQAVSESYRILKPGGVLLLTLDPLPSHFSPQQVIVKDDGAHFFTAGPNKGLLMRFCPDDEIKHLEALGWEILKDERSPRQSKILLLRKNTQIS
jgi:SAM-dependent methyltransferase